MEKISKFVGMSLLLFHLLINGVITQQDCDCCNTPNDEVGAALANDLAAIDAKFGNEGEFKEPDLNMHLNSSERVIGGQAATVGQFPFVASIVIYQPCVANIEDRYTSTCGATIIDNSAVVTAAHCLFLHGVHTADQWYRVMIKVGSIYKTIPPRGQAVASFGSWLRVRSIVMHPQYSGIYNDIALIRLCSVLSAPNTGKAILIDNTVNSAGGYFSGDSMEIAGWGLTIPGVANSFPLSLQWATVQLEDTVWCSSNVYGNQLSQQNHLCAGTSSGGQDMCSGDSGGPLFRSGGGGTAILIGVFSHNKGLPFCGNSLVPSIYMAVPTYLGWINGVLQSWNGNPFGRKKRDVNPEIFEYGYVRNQTRASRQCGSQ